MFGGEGGDLGMRVRITPVIDQSRLNAESKKVETQLNRSMGSMGGMGGFAKKLMPRSFQNFMNNLRPPKIGTAGAGGGAAGGMSAGNAAVAGAVGGLVASAMQGVIGILKKVFSVMVESSASLRGMMKMLNMGFLQIIRPFADVLAIMLRPIAMFFRVIGREVMKRVRAKRQELKSQGLSGIALGGALMAELPSIYLDVLMEQLGKIDWSTFFNKILNVLWENITQRLPDFAQKIFVELGKFGWWLWTKITEPFANIATTLAGFADWVWKEIVKALGTAATWVADMFEGAANFGAWLFNEIVGAIGDMAKLGELAQEIYDIVIGKVKEGQTDPGLKAATSATGTAGAVTGVFNAFGVDPFMGLGLIGKEVGKLLGLANGGMMTREGLIYAHAGEAVVGTDRIRTMVDESVSNAMSSLTIPINISIPGATLSDAMDRRVDVYYRTKVANRR